MAYSRLTGDGTAFGWISDGKITLGDLQPEADYILICENERVSIHSDAQGAWKGRLLHDALMCVAQRERPILWDESRLSAADAAALLAPREAPASQEEQKLSEEEIQNKPEDKRPEEPPVAYRAASGREPADALPVLTWPAKAERLKPYFDSLLPVGLFNAPGWRIVKAREGDITCCFGYRAEDDRVREVLYGVYARGGMVPPRGLQGYRYERARDGGGYWVLRQQV